MRASPPAPSISTANCAPARGLRFFLLLSGLSCLTAGHAAPPSFEASYSLQRSGIELGTMRWQFSLAANQHYTFTARSATQGLIALLHDVSVRESSRGRFDRLAFTPLQYDYEQSDKPGRDVHLAFHPAQQSVAATYKGATRELDLPNASHDKLSYILQIMQDLQQRRPPLSYTVVEDHDIERYQFISLGEDRMQTSLGNLPVIGLQRKAKTTTTFWCAPDYAYLPVKIVTQKKGRKRSELSLIDTSLPPLAAPANTAD